MTPHLFGSKNRVDIFDLEKTSEALEKALEFIASLATTKSVILFVGGKNEAQEIIKEAAEKTEMPYVASRWIGGTLTNFSEIRKRVETMLDLLTQKEKGELVKYTKERLLIDRKIEKLKECSVASKICPLCQKPFLSLILDMRIRLSEKLKT